MVCREIAAGCPKLLVEMASHDQAEDPDSSRLAESGTRLRAVLGERLSLDLSSQPTWVRNLGLLWAAAQDERAPRPQEMELQSEPEC